MTGFNLEVEYGSFLDALETYILEIDNEPLTHYGVKGMKWGVIRGDQKSTREPLKALGPDKIVRKTASGEEITLTNDPPTKVNKFLARVSKSYRNDFINSASLSISDSSGKKIGEAFVAKKSNDELYLNWLGIKKSARGKGYATAVMKAAEEFGRQQGFKRMTLEVPGNSPDARHIYEKLGFKVVSEAKDADDDPIWGGLTSMVYNFDKVAHGITEKPSLSELAHYGVKGMKWGVRREESTNAAYSSRMQANDRRQHGKRAVGRINKRMNKGETRDQALRREDVRNSRQRLAVLGGIFAARLLAEYGSVAMPGLKNYIGNRANANRAAARVRDSTLGIASKAAKTPFVKPNRRGVYNITTMR